MESYDYPIPKKNKEKLTNNCTSGSAKIVTAEVEHTYSIDRLNLIETVHKSYNDSK